MKRHNHARSEVIRHPVFVAAGKRQKRGSELSMPVAGETGLRSQETVIKIQNRVINVGGVPGRDSTASASWRSSVNAPGQVMQGLPHVPNQ